MFMGSTHDTVVKHETEDREVTVSKYKMDVCMNLALDAGLWNRTLNHNVPEQSSLSIPNSLKTLRTLT